MGDRIHEKKIFLTLCPSARDSVICNKSFFLPKSTYNFDRLSDLVAVLELLLGLEDLLDETAVILPTTFLNHAILDMINMINKSEI